MSENKTNFKLGINIPKRDMSQFYSVSEPNKIKTPEPNIFFTPIHDNREQILENIKKDLDNQFEIRKKQIEKDKDKHNHLFIH
jgi:hypothetical protein